MKSRQTVLATVKNIAFLCHPYHRGGVTRWMADAAIAAATDGHEVWFITVTPVTEFFSAKGRETMLQIIAPKNKSVHILTANVGYEFEFGTPAYRAFIYRQMIAQLPAGTPVILSDDAAVWQAATTMQHTCPVVGVLHADEQYYYNLAAQYYARTDVLACVSGRINRKVKEQIAGKDIVGLCTIPCGIDLPSMAREDNATGVQQLVYVGRISNYQKRTGDLVKICTRLVEKQFSFHLNIIGDGGEDRKTLEKAVKDGGLQQQVTFCGWLSQQDVAGRLSQSDILLLTSDFEGTPIAMMEALAAGCGMVGTRVSGIEDYEGHVLAPQCLSVFAVGDIDDAADKIIKLAAIPAGARIQAARRLAETEFSMPVCLDKYYRAIGAIPPRKALPQRVTLSLKERLYSRVLATARYLKVSITGR